MSLLKNKYKNLNLWSEKDKFYVLLTKKLAFIF